MYTRGASPSDLDVERAKSMRDFILAHIAVCAEIPSPAHVATVFPGKSHWYALRVLPEDDAIHLAATREPPMPRLKTPTMKKHAQEAFAYIMVYLQTTGNVPADDELFEATGITLRLLLGAVPVPDAVNLAALYMVLQKRPQTVLGDIFMRMYVDSICDRPDQGSVDYRKVRRQLSNAVKELQRAIGAHGSGAGA